MIRCTDASCITGGPGGGLAARTWAWAGGAALAGLLAVSAAPCGAEARTYCGVDKYGTAIPCAADSVDLVEYGKIIVCPGERAPVSQTAPRNPVCPMDALARPAVHGGVVHVAWQGSRSLAQGTLLVRRGFYDGMMVGQCGTLADFCQSDVAVPFALNEPACLARSLTQGHDPLQPGNNQNNCIPSATHERYREYRLTADQLASQASVCVVGPAQWDHPHPFPRAEGEPAVSAGVAIGPAQTLLRTGMDRPVRVCIYDPAAPERRFWFGSDTLAAGASWDGRLYLYLPASGDAFPQVDTAVPAAYAQSLRYGMSIQVHTQDAICDNPATPATPTAYANPVFQFDFAQWEQDPGNAVNLVVFTPMEQ